MAYGQMTRPRAQLFQIKIDSYSIRSISGRIHQAGHDGEDPFEGLMQMLMLIEEALSTQDCPGGWAEAAPAGMKSTGGAPGKTATMNLEILFEENHSWQGRLVWLEENRRTTFRSVLEMLSLMNDALAERQA